MGQTGILARKTDCTGRPQQAVMAVQEAVLVRKTDYAVTQQKQIQPA